MFPYTLLLQKKPRSIFKKMSIDVNVENMVIFFLPEDMANISCRFLQV